MDFAFTEEQQMLREQVRSFLADTHPPERVAELAETEDGWDESSWDQIAELGLTGLSIAEEHGGAGMGFLDEAVVFEEFGYALYPGPYLATVGLALPAIADATDLLESAASGERSFTLAHAEPGGVATLEEPDALATRAEGDGDAPSLSGTKELVADLGLVSDVVVTATAGQDMGLYLTSGGRRVSVSTMDGTRRLGTLTLEGEPARLLARGDRARALLGAARRRTLAALALEAVGIAQRALELAQSYVGERKQFDKPIGTYQAVSHQVADMYAETELARSLAYWAAWCVAESDEAVDRATAAAKSLASEAAVAACERAIQVHGGIGFTYEHVLHRYYKRAQWISSFEGTPATRRARLASALLD